MTIGEPLSDYEVVVCTRNRADALAVSLPRMLAQSVPPRRVTVVDASDDEGPVRRTLAAADQAPVQLVRSEPGSALQRNVGLRSVSAPIVFFPDDDSLWATDYAEQVLRVYARDEQQLVGAVTGEALAALPPTWLPDASYEMSSGHRLRQRISRRRAQLEHRLVPDPLAVLSGELTSRRSSLPWYDDVGTVADSWVTGFRMSFRTDLVRDVGFDTTLRDYALFEDLDLGFHIAATHRVVRARRAELFHYQHPGGRGDGYLRGMVNVLNRAYVVCKHTLPGARPRQLLLPHAGYRAVLYAAGGTRSLEHRRSARGALAATAATRRLLRAAPDELAEVYTEALASGRRGRR